MSKKLSQNLVQGCASKLGPSMLRNIIGPGFDSKKGNFCSFLQFFISLSLQKEEIFEKRKWKKRRKLGPIFDSKKAIFGPSFDYSLYICVCMYIYIDRDRRPHLLGNFGASKQQKTERENRKRQAE